MLTRRRARRVAKVALEPHPNECHELAKPRLALAAPSRRVIKSCSGVPNALTSTALDRRLTIADKSTPNGPLAHVWGSLSAWSVASDLDYAG